MTLQYFANIRLPTEKAHGYQIMKTCEAIAKQGNEVELIVADCKNPSLGHLDPFEYYGVEKCFSVKRLPVINYLNQVPHFLKSLAFWLQERSFLLRLKAIVKVNENAVFYSRNIRIANIIKRHGGKSVFVEQHMVPHDRNIVLFSNVDGVLCLTKGIEKVLIDYHSNLRTTVVPDSVDIEVFDSEITKEDARNKFGIDQDAFVVMYGGRFHTMNKGKGLDSLDRAVSEIRSINSTIQLYLVGGTGEDFKQVEKREAESSTRCVDSVDRKTLAEYYRAADVLIMPFPNEPHYAQAMSPLKMFEYMASRTLIVTSDLPTVREILDEQSAIFYQPDQYTALVDSLVKVVKLDDLERQKIVQHARDLVCQYTWEERAKMIIGFIKNEKYENSMG